MKEIFQLEINSSKCNYEIWLNDIKIDSQLNSLPIVYDLTVNQWLKKEINKIKILVLPHKGYSQLSSDEYFRVSFISANILNDTITNKQELFKLETPQFNNLKDENNALDISSYELNKIFEVDLKNENLIFSKLKISQPTHSELVDAYIKLKQLFKNKEIETLIELIDFKITEFSKVYQDSKLEEVSRQKFFLSDLFSRNIYDVDYLKYNLTSYANNTIFCLEDNKSDQPLMFSNPNDDLVYYYPFYFGVLKGEEKLIIVM